MTSRRRFLGAAGLVAGITAGIAAAWPNALRAQAQPQPQGAKGKPPKPKPEGVLVNDLHSNLNTTRVFRVIDVDSADAVRKAFVLAQKEQHPVCIAGGRHAMGGQQFGTDGLLLDTRKLVKVLDFNAERGLIEVEGGVQWPRLYEFLLSSQRGRDRQWTFAQKPSGADRMSIGGCLSANIHGRGLAMPPFISDIESFKLIDAKGALHDCSRSENEELFRLAIGGYGLFGFIYSVTLRLVPRRKLERVSDLRTVEGIAGAFAERFRDGFLYGDFTCLTDDKSADFLRQGAFTCYRLMPDDSPLPVSQRALDEKDRLSLLELAHTDKPAAFRRYASRQLATGGQLVWSDEQQMSAYPDGYHREVERRAQLPRGTDVITELCCEPAALERFMLEVRDYAKREEVDIVGATLRVIEEDKESYLNWARKPYACLSLNVHLEHSTRGMIRAGDSFRRLIDIALRHGGSFYPAYHRHALRRQMDVCFPQFQEFLKLKRKYDPAELFQSDWYKHYKSMYFFKQ
jgi:FAD/FMN-containing dehydrogenase